MHQAHQKGFLRPPSLNTCSDCMHTQPISTPIHTKCFRVTKITLSSFSCFYHPLTCRQARKKQTAQALFSQKRMLWMQMRLQMFYRTVHHLACNSLGYKPTLDLPDRFGVQLCSIENGPKCFWILRKGAVSGGQKVEGRNVSVGLGGRGCEHERFYEGDKNRIVLSNVRNKTEIAASSASFWPRCSTESSVRPQGRVQLTLSEGAPPVGLWLCYVSLGRLECGQSW